MTDRETVNGRADRAANPTSAGRDTPLPPPVVGGESILASMQEDARVTTEQGAQPFRSDQRHDEQRHLDGLTSSDPLAMSVPSDDGPTLSGDTGLGGGRARIGDKVFLGLSSGAAALVSVIVVLIAVFLVLKSVPSIAADKDNFLTSTEFTTSNGDLHFGIAALLWVTVMISVVALLLAVPVAIGIALFITQYAPARLAKPVAYIMDLLAAIPSIVYGIWGYTTLSPKLEPVQSGLSHIPIPLFKNIHTNGTIFDGAIVLAVMVLPIITAISRDVFERTPRANVEAALALGATKWEMIRIAVLPYGRAGVVSGAMLGLGRALGETIAVYLILSTVGGAFKVSLFTGGSTFASQIAGGSNEFNNPKSTGAYIAAGLVLFILTFLVNAAARTIVNRRKDFS